ncbi:MAG: Gfo/Idh/MocA family protein [Candidatus Methylacidiphilales bacterium]|nr:Gfo/Idh/MocA family oxidoreductase [Candidatus Methylacidiphilales bacterium]
MNTESRKKPIRVAIAGIGFIGQVHIESLRRIPGVEVVALCHSSQAAAEARAESWCVPLAYSDFDAMLREVRPDCVHIATPNNLHYAMVEKALLSGAHVICEKPLAVTAAEAEKLLALAQEKKAVHAVHFNVRYYPLVREMKRLREKGELGPIHAVMGSYLQDWLLYATDFNWRIDSAQSGESKAVADIGSHLIDLIEYISGLRVSAVMADFSTVHPVRRKPKKAVETFSGKLLAPADYEDVAIELEDLAHILLRFDNGARGVVAVSQVAAGRKNDVRVEFSGATHSMAWDSRHAEELWLGSRDSANRIVLRDPALVDEQTRGLISYPGGHSEGFGDTFKQLYREVYEAIRQGTPPENPSYPTFAHGCRQLTLCQKIVESSQTEAWVRV